MIFLAIDWSGAQHPRSKIWLAAANASGLKDLQPFDSRESAIEAVVDYGRAHTRVIAGFDFSFSLPLWFQGSLGVADAPELWTTVRENGEQWLAECAWPFWGRPGKPRPELPSQLRITEAQVGRSLAIKPKSTFQIGGAGAVGTGSLRGMPHLLTLQEAGWAIWPFDDAGPRTAIEIYPRALTGPVTKSQREARRRYLARTPWRGSASHLSAAIEFEDAFDAAVSALVMAQHAAELPHLPAGDAAARCEGMIWVPPSA